MHAPNIEMSICDLQKCEQNDKINMKLGIVIGPSYVSHK